jgi:hypothetical protein
MAGLERIPAVRAPFRDGEMETAPSSGQLASPVSFVPPRSQPAPWMEPYTWVPYLSTLPQSLTPLIGREDEVATGARLLSSRQARLLTLIAMIDRSITAIIILSGCR